MLDRILHHGKPCRTLDQVLTERARDENRRMWLASARAEGIAIASDNVVSLPARKVVSVFVAEGFHKCPHADIPTMCMCAVGTCDDQRLLFYQTDIKPPFRVGQSAKLATGRTVTITDIQPLAFNDGTAERQRLYRVHWETERAERGMGRFQSYTDWPREALVPVSE